MQPTPFQRLKPLCVLISRQAIHPPTHANSLIVPLSQLLDLLHTLSSSLDAKLADYVFFPLSHLFRNSKQVPLRVLELALQCLHVLVRHAWAELIPNDLSKQLLILLCLIVPSTKHEETQTAALGCLNSLWTVSSNLGLTKDGTVDPENVPLLGQSITILLDTASLHALIALKTLLQRLPDLHALQTVFPGIVSSLTKLSKAKLASPSIILLLQTLSILVVRLMHIQTPWTDTVAPQLHLVLTHLGHFRYDSRDRVRNALGDLCLSLLSRCSDALSSSKKLLLEILLASDTPLEPAANISTVQEILYEWSNALPEVARAHDDQQKLRLLRQISAAYDFLAENHALTGTIQSVLGQSTIAMAAASPPLRNLPTILPLQDEPRRFPPILFHAPSDRELRTCLQGLICQQSSARFLEHLNFDSVPTLWTLLQNPEGVLDDLYAFALTQIGQSSEQWQLEALSLEVLALQAERLGREFRPELIDALYPVLERLGASHSGLQEHAMCCLNEIARHCQYESAAACVVDNADYLVNAVALKLNAFDLSPQAPQVLIMMIRLCGAPLIPYLDDLIDSIFALLASYHGYVRLVESLFAVLNAVVEESGKSQRPLVEGASRSVSQPKRFAPLDMSEAVQLFQRSEKARNCTLTSCTGSQDEPSCTGSQERSCRIDEKRNCTDASCTDRQGEPSRIDKKTRNSTDESSRNNEKTRSPSDTSCTYSQDEPSCTNSQGESSRTDEKRNCTDTSCTDSQDEPNGQVDGQPKLSKSYCLVLKIAELTPAHLGSPSAAVRACILGLLEKAFPTLAVETDTLLPLAASLFSYLQNRVFAAAVHPFEVLAATKALTALLIAAGDFLASRIDDTWMRMVDFVGQRETSMREEVRAGRGRVGGMQWQCWDATITLLLVILEHVGIDEEKGREESIFAMLRPSLENPLLTEERRGQIKHALEGQNPDLLWLLSPTLV